MAHINTKFQHFISTQSTTTKNAEALKQLVLAADTAKLTPEVRSTILSLQEFLEENDL